MGKPKPFYVRQVLISSVDPVSGAKQSLWCIVDSDSRLEVGKWITLTNLEDGDSERRWEIMEMTQEFARHSVKRGWNNNV
jgi:predicted RNA-binding protein with PUA-like domain